MQVNRLSLFQNCYDHIFQSIFQMNYNKWNKIGKSEPRTLKKISELELNRLYIIEEIRQITTKYGEKVTVSLEGDIYCYLPAKLSTALLEKEEEGMKEIQQELTQSVVYLRRLEGRGRANAVEFVGSQPDQSLADVNLEDLIK